MECIISLQRSSKRKFRRTVQGEVFTQSYSIAFYSKSRQQVPSV